MGKPRSSSAPIIGITPDIADGRLRVSPAYGDAVLAAGGLPIVLAPRTELIESYLDLCDGFILTGGDDPDMTQWGIATHPKAAVMHPDRQRFETALLAALDDREDAAVLGVCLGMQLMGLHGSGTLDQHLPDSLATAGEHFGQKAHAVSGELGSGSVLSHHRQALSGAGNLKVVARSRDGVIEAVRNCSRVFYVGVQWHPERTESAALGRNLFEQLVEAARNVMPAHAGIQ